MLEDLVLTADNGADWARRLDRHADRTALLTADGAALTYGELLARADAMIAAAAPDGERRLTALLVRNDVASIAAYLGCLRAGNPVLLLDADGDAGRVLATFAPGLTMWPSDGRVEVGGAPAALHPELALLLPTSGSTGSPKLVRLSGAAVAANAAAIVQYLELGPDERAVTTLPIHYSFGLSVLNSHLMAGASIIVTDVSMTHPDFAGMIERLRPTSLSGVPYSFELLERSGLEARLPDSIRSLTQAGGRLPADRVRALAARGDTQGFRFFAMYGQTEASPRMAWLPHEQAAEFPDCIGRAIPGGAFSLLGDDGAVIEAAETPGELVYRGPNVMMGYALERGDLALASGPGELRTGDIAVRNSAGLYRIVGRASRFAKIAGLRIGFDDIEALLRQAGHEAVVSGDDTLVTVHVEAAVTAEARERIETLTAERCHIPEAAIAVVAGPVPRLATGKTDYAAVRRAGTAAAAARQAVAETGAHPILVGYRRAFNRSALTGEASFQALGGDSMSYVNVAVAIEKSLGQLPAQWEAMPISALVAMAPEPGTSHGRRGTRIGTETLVRLLALALVITGHAAPLDSEFLRGGAAILFLMAGYNLARFQRSAFEAGRTGPALTGSLERMILPYMVVMIPLLLASGAAWSWGWFTLVSVFTVDDAQRGPLFAFWFIETVFHALLLTILVFKVPPLRRLSRARPFVFSLALLAGALAAEILVPRYVFDDANPVSLTIDAQYYLYVLGWMALIARGRWQVMTVVVLVVVLSGWDYGLMSARQTWLSLAIATLLAVPWVPVPDRAAAIVLRIASAGYFIYISHVMMAHLLKYRFDLAGQTEIMVPALLVLSVVAGLVFERAWMAAGGLISRNFRRLRREREHS
ncbi:AMP-dependent synthetase [Polymorphobacter glacialis]|uniref:AMP-dependent synthetase n=1 Tax=Sandarakinorhabdus glacialis TaxID=1614636 RepID=A0A916ZSC8_9SPHN|nr:AMP-binding protein [Polymorphobacter glacialis]GGE11934.1 AMP-dependent synthetase [Polymorphobacter glacialis]